MIDRKLLSVLARKSGERFLSEITRHFADEVNLEWQQHEPIKWLQKTFREDYSDVEKRIIESVRDNARTAVKSCHSSGKTYTAARAVVWFLNSFQPSIVLTTAPTWRQVNSLLWGEIRAMHRSATCAMRAQPLKTPKLEYGDKWYAAGISTDEPDRFRGVHQLNILIIADEASGVSDAIFEEIRGLMASGSVVRLLLLGNPTRPQGEFYEAFNSKRPLYNTLTIDAFDTPNLAPLKAEFESLGTKVEKVALLRAAPVIVPYLVSPSWVADALEEFGEDSAFWASRVRGNFPPESPDQLIPLGWIEAAMDRWDDLPPESRWWEDLQQARLLPIETGCDIAGKGDAESVFVSRSGGVEAPIYLPGKHASTMDTTGWVMQYADKTSSKITRIDADGIGAGVYDRAREQKLKGVTAFHGGEKANNPERFINRRAEAYWNLRTRYEEGTIASARDSKKTGQLSSLKYKLDSKGRIQVESKDDMRKRGLVSPDRADAEMMAFARGGKPATAVKPSAISIRRGY